MKRSATCLALVSTLTFTACRDSDNSSLNAASPAGSDANSIWNLVKKDPYTAGLPKTTVTVSSFVSQGVDLLLASAKRTIENDSDVLPRFNKLLHPNGVCMRGVWDIDTANPYSGYFKQGSQGILIARASTTLSNTEKGSLRGFAMAGKLYPTLDENKTVVTSNFFVIDNLGGTYENNYTNAEMNNEPSAIPSASFEALGLIRIAQAAQKAFSAADVNPGLRQVYPISYLGLNGETPKTPKWMKIQGDSSEVVSNEADFRDELVDHLNKNGQITFGIYVASEKNFVGSKQWMRVGKITFDDAVASDACDHRLHFHHNKFLDNVK